MERFLLQNNRDSEILTMDIVPASNARYSERGRCRLPVELIHRLNVNTLAVPIVVVVKGIAYSCLCFPAAGESSPEQVSYDDFICYPDVSLPQLKRLQVGNFKLFPMLQESSQAASVVLKQLDGAHQSYKSLSPTIGEQIADDLQGWLVCKNCIIKNPAYMNQTFEVVRCVPMNQLVRVGRHTKVTFEFDFTPTNATSSLNIDTESVIPNVEKPTDPMLAMNELLLQPILHPEVFKAMKNLKLPRGILLYGPPGVGKTTSVMKLCDTLAQLTTFRLFSFDGISAEQEELAGTVEKKLRSLFQDAEEFATSYGAATSIIFIDEFDTLCPNRENASPHQCRVVAQLLTLMDGVRSSEGRVVVLAATNKVNDVDIAFRRAGRFEVELEFKPPDAAERRLILQQLVEQSSLRLHATVDLTEVAEFCVGFVNADLHELVKLLEISHASSPHKVSQEQVKHVLTHQMKATALRGERDFRLAKNLDQQQLSFSSIGGLDSVKSVLRRTLEWPLQHAATMSRFSIRQTKGVLLYGPPGCSKTSLVKQAAVHSKLSFLSLTGADVFSSYFGDTEASIRKVFDKARRLLPCVLFLDEIDSIVCRREFHAVSNDVSSRVLSTLLNEMDGIEAVNGLFVFAATNRPQLLDAALLRPGRFDYSIYVPLPDDAARTAILQIHTATMQLHSTVKLPAIASRLHGFTGAELESVCREAAIIALREDIDCREVHMSHFDKAVAQAKPLTTKEMICEYERFQSNSSIR